MANQLELAGAQKYKATKYAPIFVPRFFSGYATNRSPLRGTSPWMMEKFYGASNDSLIGGSNVEISPKLTLIRRPGHSQFNSATFSAVKYFHSFRMNSGNTESIRVIADTANTIYDATTTNTAIYSKGGSAGQTSMVGVGNLLYMSDGVDAPIKYDGTTVTPWGVAAPANAPSSAPLGTAGAPCRYWAPSMIVQTGYTIVDTNDNVQIMANHTSTTQNYSPSSVVGAVTSKLNYNALQWEYNSNQMRTTGAATSSPQLLSYIFATQFGLNVPGTATITGIAVSLNWLSQSTSVSQIRGVSLCQTGAAIGTAKAPNTTPTVSGSTVTWGSNADTWGLSLTPTLVNDPTFGFGIQLYTDTVRDFINSFTVTLYYTVTTDTNNLLNGVTTGQTGSAAPTWNTTLYGTTKDGTCVWTNQGPISAWQASKVYAQTVSSPSGAVVDSNGNLEIVQSTGVSGTSAPTWNTTPLATTTDNTVTWYNSGPGAQPVFTGYQYVYAYHTTNGEVSTASNASVTTGPILGTLSVTLSGVGSAASNCDYVWIFRTVDGGATFLYLDKVANPGGSVPWTYTDTQPDANLNEFLIAPISSNNNPPPTGITCLTFHLGRIWGSVGNTVYYSRVTDSTAGSGLSSFPPLNYFVFDSQVTKLWARPDGLVVFTVSDVYIIQGQGTSNSPLWATKFVEGTGLLSSNAIAFDGSIAYLFTSDSQFVAFDPSSGVLEYGLPIADELASWNPSSVYVTKHMSGSDKGIYISDGSTGWYRMSPSAAPETGSPWSPKATVAGGCSAVQSIEVSPGVRRLLIGPPSSGPILQRDWTTYSDNGTAYNANATIGSIVLAQPGQLAEVSFITTEATSVGSHANVALLFDEITGTLITSGTPIDCWGDSLTSGYGLLSSQNYPSQLATITGDTCNAYGVPGDTSTNIANRFISAAHFDDFAVIWSGRNNYQAVATVLSDINNMVSRLTRPSNYLVLSVLNEVNTAEASGHTNYNQIISLNQTLQSAFPANYVDVRSALVAAYNPANAVDVICHSQDQPPLSLHLVWATSTLNGAIDNVTTTVNLNSISGSISPGNILLVDNELMFINAVSGSTLTVARGFNGTTAAAHSNVATVTIYDQVHLSQTGYAVVAQAVASALAALPSFTPINSYVADPPQLPASSSLYSNRFYFSQTGASAWCRHLQVDISWPAENYANELLTYSLFGAIWYE